MDEPERNQSERTGNSDLRDDVTDEQDDLIAPLIERRSKRGRPTSLCLRLVLNALFYLTRTGCQWRLLPKDFPAWPGVRYSFDKWTEDGTWLEINRRLVERRRLAVGRTSTPSMGLRACLKISL
ncbi:MAG: transposase [Ardenticatenaceae bacterium]|nr:transposase [Ardenticatenaceae bacterium]